uniref:AUD1 n=1 Tax=Arundo donax TaxID=35708 RepID=A0A0A9CRW2_ARUDO
MACPSWSRTSVTASSATRRAPPPTPATTDNDRPADVSRWAHSIVFSVVSIGNEDTGNP